MHIACSISVVRPAGKCGQVLVLLSLPESAVDVFHLSVGASVSHSLQKIATILSSIPNNAMGHFCCRYLQVLWTFSIYLEAVAILPQLVLLQRTQNIDNLTGNYVFLLG